MLQQTHALLLFAKNKVYVNFFDKVMSAPLTQLSFDDKNSLIKMILATMVVFYFILVVIKVIISLLFGLIYALFARLWLRTYNYPPVTYRKALTIALVAMTPPIVAFLLLGALNIIFPLMFSAQVIVTLIYIWGAVKSAVNRIEHSRGSEN